MSAAGTDPTRRGERWSAAVKALAVRVVGGTLARVTADEIDRRGGIQWLIDLIKDWTS